MVRGFVFAVSLIALGCTSAPKRDYPDRLLMDLESQRPKGHAVAAFDADGTLFAGDVGDDFFKYTIQHHLVNLPKNPWAQYVQMRDHVDKVAAYRWLAQIYAKTPIARVREWAEASVNEQPPQFFEEQKRVIEKLKSLGVEIYIVTASITWAVEPIARRLGIAEDHVVGFETAINNGLVSGIPKGESTYREGKVKALLARTGGVAPYFAAGNTEGDLAMLESATKLRLILSSAKEGEENFATEQEMLALARERGWYAHRF